MRELWSKLQALFRREQLTDDVKDEAAVHFQMEVDANLGQGMSPAEAVAAAKRNFGNRTLIEESARQAWAFPVVEAFLQDIRFAARQFHRRPGFAVVAISTLAFGIGAATAVFTIVHAVLLRDLPYADPESLVVIWDTLPSDGDQQSQMFASYADFEQYQRGAQLIHSLAAVGRTRSQVHYGGLAHRHLAGIVSAGTFGVTLGIQAAIGRVFVEGDTNQAGCLTILQHRLWITAFGSDASIVGRDITVEDATCTVIGVMPAGFTFDPDTADLWFLLGHQPSPKSPVTAVSAFARLKPGITAGQVSQELSALHRELHRSDPADGPGSQERSYTAAADHLQNEFTYLAGPALRKNLLVVFASVSLLLLVACLNVSTLLFSCQSDRRRELVRAALGSGRGRLVRQLLTEGLLLAIAGTVLGVGFAGAAVRLFRWQDPIHLPPHAGDVGVNVPVLLFAAAVSVVSTLLFALAPAIQASNVDLAERLKAGGRGYLGGVSRLARLTAQSMIAAQIALSMMLVAGAGLLLSSVLHMQSEDLGFVQDGVTTASLALPQPKYADAGRYLQFQERLRQRLESLPGIEQAALADLFPPNVFGGSSRLEIRGAPAASPVYDVLDLAVSPGYFAVLGAPIVAGRPFDASDGPSAPRVAIVTEALARQYFPGRSPLGQTIQIHWDDGSVPWSTIVGVVGRWPHLVGDGGWRDTPAFFFPLAQRSSGGTDVQIGVRISAVRPTLNREIAAAVVELDGAIEVTDLQTVSARMASALAYPRFRAVLFTTFGLGALLLAAVGLYGLLAQLVSRRSHEFGIRRAVGAPTANLMFSVAKEGGMPVIVGLILGAAGAVASTRMIESMLFRIQAADPTMFAFAAVVLLLAAAVAIAIPARRAAKVAPMIALRDE